MGLLTFFACVGTALGLPIAGLGISALLLDLLEPDQRLVDLSVIGVSNDSRCNP